MRAVLSALAAIAVIGLAFWAYRENYATKGAFDEVARLESAIAKEREALSVLRAEWAYLNRPDRLRDLVEMNFDRLGLLPLLPEQFGQVAEITFPTAAVFNGLDQPVDVSSEEDLE